MQDVPKIARERLRAARPVRTHPDADLLTAFTEQSLPAGERKAVFEHLSRCGDCRDIVALSLPATEAIGTTARTPARGWLTWSALRWGLVAAGVVAIASIGIVQYQRGTRSQITQSQRQSQRQSQSMTAAAPAQVEFADKEAKNQPPAPPAAPEVEKRDKVQMPSAGAVTNFVDSPGSAGGAKKALAREAPAQSSPQPSANLRSSFTGANLTAGRQFPHGPRLANQMNQTQASVPETASQEAQQQAAGQLTANMQLPAVSDTVAVDVQSSQLDINAKDLAALPAQKRSATPPSATYADVTRAKPAVLGQLGGYVVDASGAAVGNARITVTPSTAGGSATAMTNSQGAWLIAGLPTGRYKAQAEAPGFKTTVLDLIYDANRPSIYSFSLSPGSVSETVEVSAAATQVQTGAALGGAITKGEFNQAPVSGRNFTQLNSFAPRWSINSAGSLQRSVDQGASWQVVQVEAPGHFTDAMGVDSSGKPLHRKVRQMAAPTFRAVSASGSEVWAGGSSLYHSQDAGLHWTRVVPASSGTVLTGEIVSLEFVDQQHGKLSTSTAESWTTADDGQSWQKQ